MDIEKHQKEFLRIIEKYNLSDEQKAEKISNFLIKNANKAVSPEEFSILFAITKEEAMIFLSFIEKGIKFKEENMDKK